MDRYEYGDPEFFCTWCQTANWEPSQRCAYCGRFRPGTRFDRICGHESNIKRERQREAEQLS